MHTNIVKTVNSIFERKKSKLISFYDPNGSKATIYYILIRFKRLRSAIDCNIRRPLTISSVHNMLIPKVKNIKTVVSLRYKFILLRDISNVNNDIIKKFISSIDTTFVINPALGVDIMGF